MPRRTPTDPTKSSAPPESSDRLTQRVIEACDAVGAFIEGWGFRSIHGRVWALLALHETPMTQTEAADLLGVSRSLVNLAVSELLSFGLLRAVGDHRNAPYQASMDVWPTIAGVLREREFVLIQRAHTAFQALAREADRSGAHPYSRARIALLLGMTELAQAVLTVILTVRVPRAPEGFGQWLTRTSAFIKRLRKLPGL